MGLYNLINRSMPKQPKCPTCSKGWCKNHLFEILPLRKDLYYKKIQKIRLCPKLHKPSNKYQKSVPLFNKDQKFYTPSFIMEEEQKFYEENDQRMKQNHMQKINSNKSGQSQMFVPKHGRKKNYCSVCHLEYQDYRDVIISLSQHVESEQHKNKLKENRFNRYILQLEEIVKKSVPKIQVQIEKKAATSQVDETADVMVMEKKEQKKPENEQILDDVLELLFE